MEVFLNNREKLVLADDKISSGGEGEVHRVVYSTSFRYNNVCAKIYFKNKRTDQLYTKIKYMVKNPPSDTNRSGFKICWPKDCIYNEKKEFIGFVMELAFPESQSLGILTSTQINKRLDSIWEERYGRRQGPRQVLNRLKLIYNLLQPIYILHSTGKYVLQDFKPANVLITPNGKISLIDMDSVQINDSGMVFKGSAATPEYIPPEFYIDKNIGKSKLATVSWDMFAVSVVNYQILFGIHPYAVFPKNLEKDEINDISTNIRKNYFAHGKHKPELELAPPHKFFEPMPSTIQNLFRNTFCLNNQRPGCREWIISIQEIIDVAKREETNSNNTNQHSTNTNTNTNKESSTFTHPDYIQETKKETSTPPKYETKEGNSDSNSSSSIWGCLILMGLIITFIICFMFYIGLI